MQRDPLGYADGMNLYQYVRSNPLSFTDPEGLQIVIVLDPHKDQSPFPGRDVTHREFIEQAVGGWNDGIAEAREIARDSRNNVDIVVNGQKMSSEEFQVTSKELEATVFRQIPSQATSQQVAQFIQEASQGIGDRGEILFESHGMQATEQFGTSIETSIRFGLDNVEISSIRDLFVNLTAKITFGSCFLKEKDIEQLANDLQTPVAGSSGTIHKIWEMTVDGTIIRIDTPFHSQQFRSVPQTPQGR